MVHYTGRCIGSYMFCHEILALEASGTCVVLVYWWDMNVGAIMPVFYQWHGAWCHQGLHRALDGAVALMCDNISVQSYPGC